MLVQAKIFKVLKFIAAVGIGIFAGAIGMQALCEVVEPNRTDLGICWAAFKMNHATVQAETCVAYDGDLDLLTRSVAFCETLVKSGGGIAQRQLICRQLDFADCSHERLAKIFCADEFR